MSSKRKKKNFKNHDATLSPAMVMKAKALAKRRVRLGDPEAIRAACVEFERMTGVNWARA